MAFKLSYDATPLEQLKGLECRNVTYAPSPDGKHDFHVVKEYIHFPDGSTKPNLRLIPDYEREFWVTKEMFRNHNDKKEYEYEQKLQRYTTTQSRLVDKISRVLHSRPSDGRTQLRTLAQSPYLYGCDISSTSLVKKDYKRRHPECLTPKASVSVLDIETNVHSPGEEIILITLSFKDKIYTAINTDFIKKGGDAEKRIQAMLKKMLPEECEERKIKLELGFFDTPGKCCKAVIDKAHEWMPDFVVVWNINFDLPKIIKTLEAEGFDLAQVFSDPLVPSPFRFFNYKEGKKQKVMQSGKVIPLHPADRWHTVECPASFYFLDAMCLYKRIRTAKGMEPSYSLDYILTKFFGKGKLSIPAADQYSGLAWHQYMQMLHPLEYVIYNIYDCIGVEKLDEKTNDVAQSFPLLCGDSDFSNFSSNPRKIVDDMHYYYRELEKPCVIASTGSEIIEENDEHVVNLKEWIVTLPAFSMDKIGLPIILGLPSIISLLVVHAADLDIEGTYPTLEEVMNLAKETTIRELVEILGIPDELRRVFGINISGGVANSIEIMHLGYNAALPSDWLAFAKEEEAAGRV